MSLTLPGNHGAAYPVWFDWQVEIHPLLKDWFELMWDACEGTASVADEVSSSS